MARLLAHTAQNAILLALLVTVVNETGSTIHSSLLVLGFVVPSALVGILGGVAVDRLPKREVLVTTGLFRAALCLLFLRLGSGVLAIYLTNTLLAVITQFASPAESAVLPALVPEAQLVPATAALNLEFIASQLLGTVVLAPVLVRTVGLRPLFLASAVAFLASTALYARIPALDGGAPVADAGGSDAHALVGIRGAARESWQLVRSDQRILLSVIDQTLVAMTVVVLISILPVFTRETLHLSAEYSVAVFSPAAIGMFLSLRLIPALVHRMKTDRLVTLGFTVFVILLGLLGVSRALNSFLMAHDPLGLLGIHLLHGLYSPVLLSVLLAGPLGFAYGVVLVAARAVLYERVPGAMQGRVFAFQGVIGSLASIPPLVLVGVVAYWLGASAVILLIAAAIAAAAWYVPRRIRPAASQPPRPAPSEKLRPSPDGSGS
jgi:MFS family permease